MRRHPDLRRWAFSVHTGTVAIAVVWSGCNLVPQTLPPGGGSDNSLGSAGSGSGGSGGSSGSSGYYTVPGGGGDASTTAYEAGAPQSAYDGAGAVEAPHDAGADGTTEASDAASSILDASVDAGADASADGAAASATDGACTDAGETGDADTVD
jgi:hypothetical protein